MRALRCRSWSARTDFDAEADRSRAGTGPISSRNRTDLEPEFDRSRRGTGPISAPSPRCVSLTPFTLRPSTRTPRWRCSRRQERGPMAPMSSTAGCVEQLPLPGKAFRNGRAPRGAECAPVRRTRARAGQRWCERGSLTTFRTIPLYESRW